MHRSKLKWFVLFALAGLAILLNWSSLPSHQNGQRGISGATPVPLSRRRVEVSAPTLSRTRARGLVQASMIVTVTNMGTTSFAVQPADFALSAENDIFGPVSAPGALAGTVVAGRSRSGRLTFLLPAAALPRATLLYHPQRERLAISLSLRGATGAVQEGGPPSRAASEPRTPAVRLFPAATARSAPGAKSIALGAWVPGSPWDGGKALDAFASLVGYRPAIDMWYENWATARFSPSDFNVVAARGEVPMLSWGPCRGNYSAGGHICSDAAIAGGIADSYLRTFAHAAAVWGKPFFLRMAWEMNSTWYGWGPGQNGNTPASLVAMWRHVHDILVASGATNVRWVWCPNTLPEGRDFRPFYPGDAYVDYVGLDGYNWGTAIPEARWLSFTQTFQRSYHMLLALTRKPVIIGEMASSEVGGNKAAWITSAYLREIPATFPRLVAVVWFDEDKETDWRVNSSGSSLAAYRRVAASPLYQPTRQGLFGAWQRSPADGLGEANP